MYTASLNYDRVCRGQLGVKLRRTAVNCPKLQKTQPVVKIKIDLPSKSSTNENKF